MSDNTHQVTQAIAAAVRGEREAAAKLLPLVYDDLKALARARMGRVPPGNTLQPTALVHEVCLRLLRSPGAGWGDSNEFYRVAAQAMRNLLIDPARARRSLKRGGGMARVALEGADGAPASREVDLVALDDSLTKLAAMDQRLAETFEYRFLVGLSVERTAELLGVSSRTVELDTRLLRAWLKKELVG